MERLIEPFAVCVCRYTSFHSRVRRRLGIGAGFPLRLDILIADAAGIQQIYSVVGVVPAGCRAAHTSAVSRLGRGGGGTPSIRYAPLTVFCVRPKALPCVVLCAVHAVDIDCDIVAIRVLRPHAAGILLGNGEVQRKHILLPRLEHGVLIHIPLKFVHCYIVGQAVDHLVTGIRVGVLARHRLLDVEVQGAGSPLMLREHTIAAIHQSADAPAIAVGIVITSARHPVAVFRLPFVVGAFFAVCPISAGDDDVHRRPSGAHRIAAGRHDVEVVLVVFAIIVDRLPLIGGFSQTGVFKYLEGAAGGGIGGDVGLAHLPAHIEVFQRTLYGGQQRTLLRLYADIAGFAAVGGVEPLRRNRAGILHNEPGVSRKAEARSRLQNHRFVAVAAVVRPVALADHLFAPRIHCVRSDGVRGGGIGRQQIAVDHVQQHRFDGDGAVLLHIVFQQVLVGKGTGIRQLPC